MTMTVEKVKDVNFVMNSYCIEMDNWNYTYNYKSL